MWYSFGTQKKKLRLRNFLKKIKLYTFHYVYTHVKVNNSSAHKWISSELSFSLLRAMQLGALRSPLFLFVAVKSCWFLVLTHVWQILCAVLIKLFSCVLLPQLAKSALPKFTFSHFSLFFFNSFPFSDCTSDRLDANQVNIKQQLISIPFHSSQLNGKKDTRKKICGWRRWKKKRKKKVFCVSDMRRPLIFVRVVNIAHYGVR